MQLKNMQLELDKKFLRRRRASFIFLSFSGLIVIAACAYFGFKISGSCGAFFGVFFGLTISAC